MATRKPPESGYRLVAEGKASWMPLDYPCPKRGGVEHLTWGSCAGCRYLKPYTHMDAICCTHPSAGPVGAQYLGELIAQWESEHSEPAPPVKRAVKLLESGLEPKKDDDGQLPLF